MEYSESFTFRIKIVFLFCQHFNYIIFFLNISLNKYLVHDTMGKQYNFYMILKFIK